MGFSLFIDPRAFQDIQDAIHFYEERKPGLELDFMLELEYQFQILVKNPWFRVRYKQVRCLPLNKFPFMVHFILDEQQNSVIVLAVLNTSLNPKSWPNEGQ
jgi:hypothetical protein